MSILKIHGERTTPDFIEEDFISAIETSLNRSIYFRNKSVEIRRISQADENELGYDGILNTIVPFYIQFKRSDFYSPHFSGKLATDRKNVSLPVDKGFFAFELLRKNNRYEQHNAMCKLSQENKAAYVAPMFYKSGDLSKLKSEAEKFIPIYYDDILFYDPFYSGLVTLRNLSLFRKSITIPPHDLVNDTNPSHHYSYSRDKKIGFHSEPTNLEDSNAQTLYYFIQEVFNQQGRESKSIIDSNYRLLPELFGFESNSSDFSGILEASVRRVSVVDSETKINSIIEQFDTIDKLIILEDILYHYFNIRQFIKYENMA
ncbi:hypothetical protein [Sphingobacterium paramultivorum]|uniref:hypothetical protein n=1 Tax=Sphingobacterium paramultivorum TaxID=2886510 RepID=UPI00129CAED6|nr:hypothetical protein [Sphingobacterium paramultivorum]